MEKFYSLTDLKTISDFNFCIFHNNKFRAPKNLGRKTKKLIAEAMSFWCARRDLNPHVRSGH